MGLKRCDRHYRQALENRLLRLGNPSAARILALFDSEPVLDRCKKVQQLLEGP